jgi:hypothetical protein
VASKSSRCIEVLSDLYSGKSIRVCSGSRFVGEGDRGAKNLTITQRRRGFDRFGPLEA